MHSRVLVCDEIIDLLVASSKCLNAPILIVVEIHGAIRALILAVISVPEVVPVHLDPRLELADRPDPDRAALLALEMTIVVAIRVLTHVVVIVRSVVNLGIDRAATVVLVVNLVTGLVGIAVLVVIVPVVTVTGLLVVMDPTHVAILVVVIALTLVWRRRRAPAVAAERELDPALDERVDEALRAFGDDE